MPAYPVPFDQQPRPAAMAVPAARPRTQVIQGHLRSIACCEGLVIKAREAAAVEALEKKHLPIGDVLERAQLDGMHIEGEVSRSLRYQVPVQPCSQGLCSLNVPDPGG